MSLVSKEENELEKNTLPSPKPNSVRNVDDTEVYPFVNHLVEYLYTNELHELIKNTVQSEVDKRTFVMYIMFYFYTYLNISKDTSKKDIKLFMTSVIKNSEKRKKLIEFYLIHEKMFKTLI